MKKNTICLAVIFGLLFIVCNSATAATTALSQKASRIKSGMTKAQVIQILGPATWASIPGDTGEYALPDPGYGAAIYTELRWNNPGCMPIVVAFDQHMKVNGKDEGRAVCFKGVEKFYPSADYSCEKEDRLSFCK